MTSVMPQAAVLDTMMFAYALLGEKNCGETALSVIQHTATIHVPDHLRSELANVLWQWIRHTEITTPTALTLLDTADSLFSRVHSTNTLWHAGLQLAAEYCHPAYDTLFIALANRLEVPLITWDKKLLSLFPDVALHPDKYLNSNGDLLA